MRMRRIKYRDRDDATDDDDVVLAILLRPIVPSAIWQDELEAEFCSMARQWQDSTN